MNQTLTPPLEDRIRQIRADVGAIIDARAEAVAEECPGVPLGVIRNLLTARAPTCACAQYLELSGEGRLPPDAQNKAPLSGIPCTWWRYKVEERESRRQSWSTVVTRTVPDIIT